MAHSISTDSELTLHSHGTQARRWRTHLVVALSCLLLLLLWQFGAWLVDAQVILPGPGSVGQSLLGILGARPFALNVWETTLRALQSFVIIVASSVILGSIAGMYPLFRAAMSPILTVLKATPVMSIILLAFIWFNSGTVPVFSAFLMGFPVMFIQMVQGVRSMDPSLSQMCDIYGFSWWTKLHSYVVPSLVPSVIVGSRMTLSMVWKVVIAAEVITVPRYGIGSRMQLAQVNLDTADVLAWTVVAILLTAVGELFFDLLMHLFRRFSNRRMRNSTKVGTV